MKNALTIRRGSSEYTATVVDQGRTTVIDLSGMRPYERVVLVGKLWAWKITGFKGNPPS